LLAVTQSAADDKGQKLETPSFLSFKELPNHIKYLSEPVTPDSVDFVVDDYYYHWGKQQRTTPRGVQAAIDEVQWTSKSFSEAAGFIIGPKECPEIFKLVEGARIDANTTNKRAKDYYRRIRPFVHYGEPSLVAEDDSAAAESFGYPSGHSVRGWVYALTLALVVPDSTEALIRRAQDYALSRVICGRHYKSDTDASLVEATAVMSRLLSNDAFLAQLARAREEYARSRGVRRVSEE
jgi:acid phosphatase (class A)